MATGLEQESLTQGLVLSAREGGPRGTALGSWASWGKVKRLGTVLPGRGCWEEHWGGMLWVFLPWKCVCIWGSGG